MVVYGDFMGHMWRSWVHARVEEVLKGGQKKKAQIYKIEVVITIQQSKTVQGEDIALWKHDTDKITNQGFHQKGH